MAKCGACDSTILLGGTRWSAWTFCDAACANRLKVALTEKFVTAPDIEKQVMEVHRANCLLCGADQRNDVYTAKKVTGMILAVQWTDERQVSCYRCAKKQKLAAFLHCLVLGWWSPKAAITNLFYIPYNLIGIAFTKPTPYPSKHLTASVKQIIADRNAHAFAAALRQGQ